MLQKTSRPKAGQTLKDVVNSFYLTNPDDLHQIARDSIKFRYDLLLSYGDEAKVTNYAPLFVEYKYDKSVWLFKDIHLDLEDGEWTATLKKMNTTISVNTMPTQSGKEESVGERDFDSFVFVDKTFPAIGSAVDYVRMPLIEDEFIHVIPYDFTDISYDDRSFGTSFPIISGKYKGTRQGFPAQIKIAPYFIAGIPTNPEKKTIIVDLRSQPLIANEINFTTSVTGLPDPSYGDSFVSFKNYLATVIDVAEFDMSSKLSDEIAAELVTYAAKKPLVIGFASLMNDYEAPYRPKPAPTKEELDQMALFLKVSKDHAGVNFIVRLRTKIAMYLDAYNLLPAMPEITVVDFPEKEGGGSEDLPELTEEEQWLLDYPSRKEEEEEFTGGEGGGPESKGEPYYYYEQPEEVIELPPPPTAAEEWQMGWAEIFEDTPFRQGSGTMTADQAVQRFLDSLDEVLFE